MNILLLTPVPNVVTDITIANNQIDLITHFFHKYLTNNNPTGHVWIQLIPHKGSHTCVVKQLQNYNMPPNLDYIILLEDKAIKSRSDVFYKLLRQHAKHGVMSVNIDSNYSGEDIHFYIKSHVLNMQHTQYIGSAIPYQLMNNNKSNDTINILIDVNIPKHIRAQILNFVNDNIDHVTLFQLLNGNKVTNLLESSDISSEDIEDSVKIRKYTPFLDFYKYIQTVDIYFHYFTDDIMINILKHHHAVIVDTQNLYQVMWDIIIPNVHSTCVNIIDKNNSMDYAVSTIFNCITKHYKNTNCVVENVTIKNVIDNDKPLSTHHTIINDKIKKIEQLQSIINSQNNQNQDKKAKSHPIILQHNLNNIIHT